MQVSTRTSFRLSLHCCVENYIIKCSSFDVVWNFLAMWNPSSIVSYPFLAVCGHSIRGRHSEVVGHRGPQLYQDLRGSYQLRAQGGVPYQRDADSF